MSVKKRGDRWQARVEMGPDPATGKRTQVSATFNKAKDAERWEREMLAQRDRGLFTTYDRTPLAAYLEKWAAGKEGIKESSRRAYRQRIKDYIVPTLGGTALCEVRARHIHDLIHGTLVEKGLSANTRGHALRVLRDALGDAERLDLVPRNEATRVDMPPSEPPPAKHWTAPQVRRYLATASHDRHWPLWLLAAHTGMRRGELLGLRWGDLDASAGVIAVAQQVTPAPGVGKEEGPPKTKGSARIVALPPSCLEALQAHRARQNQRRLLLGRLWDEDHDLIFPNHCGRPQHPSTITERHRLLCERAGLEHIRLHDIRHSCSSMLHALGVPMRVVADMLGHSDLDTTAHYTHADLSAQREAAAALERLLAEGTGG